jgi:hypothetical protein
MSRLPEWELDNAYALRCLFVNGAAEDQFITQRQLEIEPEEGRREQSL